MRQAPVVRKGALVVRKACRVHRHPGSGRHTCLVFHLLLRRVRLASVAADLPTSMAGRSTLGGMQRLTGSPDREHAALDGEHGSGFCSTWHSSRAALPYGVTLGNKHAVLAGGKTLRYKPPRR